MVPRFGATWVCVLLMQQLVLAQHGFEISGTVADTQGQRVPGVTVQVADSQKGTVTDIDGNFSLSGIAKGKYTLVFRGVGYATQEMPVHINNKDLSGLSVSLEEEQTQLDELIVYGKSDATLLEQKGFSVNALELKDISLQSIQVNDILDRSAGVRIRQSGGLGSHINYNINGLSGNSIRIFLDGIPIDNYGSSYSLNSIPSSSIRRVEIYKGVVPVEFGGDALGGAINIVTKNMPESTLDISYSAGSFNTHQASINGGYRNNSSGFTFRGSGFYNYSDNSYKVWGNKVYTTDERGKKSYIEAKRFHDSYQSKGVRAEIGFTNVKWADQALLGVTLSDMDKDIQHGATMEVVYGNRRVSQSTQMLNATYIKDKFLIDALKVNAFVSRSRLKRNLVDTTAYMYDWSGSRVVNPVTGEYFQWQSGGEGGAPTLNQDDETNYTGRMNLVYTLNKNNKLVANGLMTSFTRRPDDPLRPERERELTDTRRLTKGLAGISFENEMLANKLKSTLFYKYYFQSVGLKDPIIERDTIIPYEYSKETDNSGYGLAVSYAVHRLLIVQASAENTIRLPNSRELFGNTTDNVEASYELNPERSVNFNLGLDFGPLRGNKHAFGVKANVFYRNIRDRIMPGVPDQQDETFTYVNVSEVLSTGVDVELDYSFREQLFSRFGMSLANPRFNTKYDANGAPYLYYGDRLRNEPFFTLNNNLRYNKEDLLQEGALVSAYYNIAYVHEFYRNWPSIGGAGKDNIPAQLVHDIGVSYTFPNRTLTLSLDAKNLLNEQVFDNWALQKPGRAFYGKINYKIF